MVLRHSLVVVSVTKAANRAKFCTYCSNIILNRCCFFALFLQALYSFFKLALLSMKELSGVKLCDVFQLAILDTLVETKHFVDILRQHFFFN